MINYEMDCTIQSGDLDRKLKPLNRDIMYLKMLVVDMDKRLEALEKAIATGEQSHVDPD